MAIADILLLLYSSSSAWLDLPSKVECGGSRIFSWAFQSVLNGVVKKLQTVPKKANRGSENKRISWKKKYVHPQKKSKIQTKVKVKEKGKGIRKEGRVQKRRMGVKANKGTGSNKEGSKKKGRGSKKRCQKTA